MIKEIRTLLISGGGPKVSASVTALERAYLSELFEFNLEHIATVSAGSLLGLMILLDYKFDEIKEEILSIDAKRLIEPKLSNLITEWGIEKGELFIKWIECILIKKGYSPKITLKELFEKIPVKLSILAYNINSVKSEYYNYLTSPEMKVTKAIRYSINIPCFFTRQYIKDELIVDLGLITNYPCNYFSEDIENLCKKEDIEYLLGINIKKDNNYIKKDIKIDNFIEYFTRIIDIINVKLNESERTECHKKHKYTIEIKNLDINPVNFNIEKEKIEELFRIGENAFEEFLDSF